MEELNSKPTLLQRVKAGIKSQVTTRVTEVKQRREALGGAYKQARRDAEIEAEKARARYEVAASTGAKFNKKGKAVGYVPPQRTGTLREKLTGSEADSAATRKRLFGA
jgi:hypothetical protein